MHTGPLETLLQTTVTPLKALSIMDSRQPQMPWRRRQHHLQGNCSLVGRLTSSATAHNGRAEGAMPIGLQLLREPAFMGARLPCKACSTQDCRGLSKSTGPCREPTLMSQCTFGAKKHYELVRLIFPSVSSPWQNAVCMSLRWNHRQEHQLTVERSVCFFMA